MANRCPQPETVASFYSQLFGWSMRKDNALRYRELSSGNPKVIDDGVWPAPPEATGFVPLYAEVPDIDAWVADAVTLGATIIVPKQCSLMAADGRAPPSHRIRVAICLLDRVTARA